MTSVHDCFIQPDNVNTYVWRYLSIEKLISLLMTKSLYFSRIDMFKDPFEGTLPTKTKSIYNAIIEKIWGDSDNQGLKENILKYKNISMKYTYVCCWNMSDHESSLMWKSYTDMGKGIAIKTTYNQLWNSLPDHIGSSSIYLGLIQYIDYKTETFPPDTFFNVLYPFTYKRSEFQSEHEVRGFVQWGPKWNEKLHFSSLDTNTEPGINVPLDATAMSNILQNIVISPYVPDYHEDVIKEIIHLYGFDPSIVLKSSLKDNPIIF
jgi:hypothetical protein